MDNTHRFTGKAEIYTKARPCYAPEFIRWLFDELGFRKGQVVADIGCGPGNLAEALVKKGCTVYGVEPNEDMRNEGEGNLAAYDRFISVRATAEHTGLADKSVDWVTVGQAFHWFDPVAFKNECQRILKVPEKIVLVWNVRIDDNAQVRETASVFGKFCPEFKGFGGGLAHIQDRIAAFFNHSFAARRFRHDLICDKDKFIERSLSGSYALQEEDPQYPLYVAALEALFEKYAVGRLITIPNETIAYYTGA